MTDEGIQKLCFWVEDGKFNRLPVRFILQGDLGVAQTLIGKGKSWLQYVRDVKGSTIEQYSLSAALPGGVTITAGSNFGIDTVNIHVPVSGAPRRGWEREESELMLVLAYELFTPADAWNAPSSFFITDDPSWKPVYFQKKPDKRGKVAWFGRGAGNSEIQILELVKIADYDVLLATTGDPFKLGAPLTPSSYGDPNADWSPGPQTVPLIPNLIGGLTGPNLAGEYYLAGSGHVVSYCPNGAPQVQVTDTTYGYLDANGSISSPPSSPAYFYYVHILGGYHTLTGACTLPNGGPTISDVFTSVYDNTFQGPDSQSKSFGNSTTENDFIAFTDSGIVVKDGVTQVTAYTTSETWTDPTEGGYFSGTDNLDVTETVTKNGPNLEYLIGATVRGAKHYTDDSVYSFLYEYVEEDSTATGTYSGPKAGMNLTWSSSDSWKYTLMVNCTGKDYRLDTYTHPTPNDPFVAILCRIYDFFDTPVYVFSWWNKITKMVRYGYVFKDKLELSITFPRIVPYYHNYDHDCYKSTAKWGKHADGYARACYKQERRQVKEQ